MISDKRKPPFMAVIFCMDCLKDDFGRDALDPNRSAPDGALKWCSGTYVATTEAKQRRYPSGATARESTLECCERHPNGTCDIHFSAHTVPRARDMQPMPDRRP